MCKQPGKFLSKYPTAVQCLLFFSITYLHYLLAIFLSLSCAFLSIFMSVSNNGIKFIPPNDCECHKIAQSKCFHSTTFFFLAIAHCLSQSQTNFCSIWDENSHRPIEYSWWQREQPLMFLQGGQHLVLFDCDTWYLTAWNIQLKFFRATLCSTDCKGIFHNFLCLKSCMGLKNDTGYLS